MFVVWEADRVAWEMAITGSSKADRAGQKTVPSTFRRRT